VTAPSIDAFKKRLDKYIDNEMSNKLMAYQWLIMADDHDHDE
jgi:hypothetical protein